MEIERKFLVRQLPEDYQRYQKQRIEQAYLSTDPVVRFRRLDNTYILTCKGSGLMAREEREIPITEEAYRKLSRGPVISECPYCHRILVVEEL